MSEAAVAQATYADVLDAPPHRIAEVIAGELHLSPRPSAAHALAATVLGEELGPPFRRGKGGPGGWHILFEPELHLGDEPAIVVPDLAGWRRATLPALEDVAYFETRPDWLCEVLSPSTHQLDRTRKVPLYASVGIPHVWLLDPRAKLLEVLRLDGESYRLVASHGGDQPVRAEPFDAIPLELGALWLDATANE